MLVQKTGKTDYDVRVYVHGNARWQRDDVMTIKKFRQNQKCWEKLIQVSHINLHIMSWISSLFVQGFTENTNV